MKKNGKGQLNKKQILLISAGFVFFFLGIGEIDLLAFFIAKEIKSPAIKDFFITHKCKITDKNLSQLKERFIVLDVETTGLDEIIDRIVSIGAIRFVNGEPIDQFYTLVNPMRSISPDASSVNGITDADVVSAPKEQEACIQLFNFLNEAVNGKTLVVAYNSSFDMDFIKYAMNRSSISGNVRHFDVYDFAKKKISNTKNYKLVTVARHLGIDTANAHNALADCRMCAAVLLKLLN